MLVIVIILATLLAISAGLHVYQQKQLDKWEDFDQTSTEVLADAIRNVTRANMETSRWRQRCFATLDRNLWLRTRLEELQVQYDDLFVRYCKQSLSATEVGEDAAEILGDFVNKAMGENLPLPQPEDIDSQIKDISSAGLWSDPEDLAKNGHWIEGMGYVKWVDGAGYVPLSPQPFVNDVEEVDPEVSIDYYVVDRGE